MKNKFSDYKINITDAQEKAFNDYYDILIEYNEKFNITAITEREEVIEKHFIDSALGAEKIKGKTLIDIGSGGGFPAIPIKIMRDDLSVTMIEATGKKCEFLKAVIKKLNLKGITVINGRAEDLAKNELYREKFDVCTARAVARLNTLSEYCMPFIKVGGQFVSYKGDAKEETREAENAIKILGGKINSVNEYLLGDAKRTLVVIDKIKNTEKKYPRGNGKERKTPL